MPKALKKYKNVKEFLSGVPAFKKEMEKKHKLPAKDIDKYGKLTSDKAGIEKKYMSLVEEDPKLKKISSDIDRAEKAVKGLSKAQDEYIKAHNTVEQINKGMKSLEDEVRGDKKQLFGNDKYQKLRQHLDAANKNYAVAEKKIAQRSALQKQFEQLLDVYDKEKDKIAKSYGVTLTTDAKSLIVLMGKSAEYSMIIG
ncbi:hypothetical protein [Pseudovibrio brasiliensis]|uniref:Chromosome partition protein Smc n=1 Tax=Pseudovibrio brasiliensis TaxID=1898042 RepID=A0ABX8AH35_9HYPH|nr:hypothetical protein [Pseudovibrio brasiliensis]QUS53967.1 hypothetical protein KGB56_10975 [Pseudovibrio brasiliensis]